MVVTIDTNILFQALYSNKGASHFIFQLILDEKLLATLSVPVLEEYKEVLLRNRCEFDLMEHEIEKILYLLITLSKKTEIRYLWRPNLSDETDNKFVELAIASQSNYLITRNIKDYTKNNELTGFNFEVIRPCDFCKKWRKDYE